MHGRLHLDWRHRLSPDHDIPTTILDAVSLEFKNSIVLDVAVERESI